MRLFFVVAALVVAGCGDHTVTPTLDMSAPLPPEGADLQVYSLCSHPGDTGNSQGVGKFCLDSSDCMGQPALACSTLLPIPQGPTDFCTTLCDPNAADPNAPCGENASCTCISPTNPSQCGCVPNVCRIGLFG